MNLVAYRKVMLARSTTHGRSRTREYLAWRNARQRCYNPNDISAVNYGNRGIGMAPEWRTDFTAFLAHMGHCPAGLTLDRMDNERGYEPGNCRWATATEQQQNKRNVNWITINGDTLCLSEWARRTGLSRKCIANRIQCGWPEVRWLEQPSRSRPWFMIGREPTAKNYGADFLKLAELMPVTDAP